MSVINRKPRVFCVSQMVYDNTVDTVNDYLPDDVLYVHTTSNYRFADDSPLIYYRGYSKQLVFHHTRTDHIADPIDWFSEVLASSVIDDTQMYLNPSRESTIKRFPQIDPRWYRIYVTYRLGALVGQPAVQFTANSKFFVNPNATEYCSWAWGRDYTLGAMVVSRCTFKQQFAVEPLLGYYGESVTFNDNGTNIDATLFIRPYVLVQHAANTVFKDSPLKRLLPPDRVYIRDGGVVDSRKVGFSDSAHLRLPFYLDRVLGVAIALDPLDLPPYVLLEIVDWLPKMELWAHGKKIAIILKAQASMRRIKAARTLMPSKEPKLE